MLETYGGRDEIMSMLLDAARATSDFYIDSASATDGIPYRDTGAPGLASLPHGAIGRRIRTTIASQSTAPQRPSQPRDYFGLDTGFRHKGITSRRTGTNRPAC